MEIQYIIKIPETLFVVSGGIITLILYFNNRREKRKERALELFLNIHGDKEFRKILYYVDGGGKDGLITHKGKLEKEADRTLKYLNYIGLLLERKSISISDILVYGYEIKRILNNCEVQNYIKELKKHGINLNGLDYLKKQLL